MAFDLIKYLTENSIPHSVSENGAINVLSCLDLADNKDVTTLPDNLTVDGDLNLRKTQITKLPENLTVGCDLELSDTQIATLPESLTVGWGLDLEGTPIAMLPEGLTLGGDLDLRKTQINTLPRNLVVGGSLNLRGTQITMLPDGLTVGHWLNLYDTLITKLPEQFTCGALFLDPERFSNVAFRKNFGNDNRTFFAVWTGKTFHIADGSFYRAIERFEDISFYGPIDKFEKAVDRKYSGEAAEAYKQAARDCINELKEKLSARPE